MSCNGFCYATTRINPEGLTYRGDFVNHAPSGFQPIATYMSDPHALTAREFGMQRNHYFRQQDEAAREASYQPQGRQARGRAYASVIPSLQPATPQYMLQHLSQLQANILYQDMLLGMGTSPEYSFTSQLRSLWENAQALANQGFSVVSASSGHMRAYTSMHPQAERASLLAPAKAQFLPVSISEREDSPDATNTLEQERNMLEDLIRKEKILLS